jgi:hypothetical protein
MQGTIAQIVALVIEGNAALRGASSSGLSAQHSTMTFCEFVRFIDLAKTPTGWSERPIADSPNSWFQYLRERKVNALRMVYGPSNDPNVDGKTVTDRMLVGFIGGGGRWLIKADKPTSSDYWESRWNVGDQEREDRRIWRVTYGRFARNRPLTSHQEPDLAVIRNDLDSILNEIRAFALEQRLDGFAKCFERALQDLSAESEFNGFHKELANRDLLPLGAVQLLSAAQSAWVFGGMGSWNDLGFDGEVQDDYERLSETLYHAINQAVVAATNCSATQPNSLGHSGIGARTAKKRPWWKIFG